MRTAAAGAPGPGTVRRVTVPEQELREAWHRLVGGAPEAPGSAHEHLLEGLLARLREPHRRYHTATHVRWVLRHVHDLVDQLRSDTLDVDALRLAALYHDAVYDPRADDNEAASAALVAETAGSLGWTPERCRTVADLVLATDPRHAPPRDPANLTEVDVLLDADLAVLATEPNDYESYRRGVRAEYTHLDDGAWRAGRREVLRHLLARDPLFRTLPMQPLAPRARANLTAELASLGR